MLSHKRLKYHTITLFVTLAICFILAQGVRGAYADSHAESAFFFADKHDWGNAIAHAKSSEEKNLTLLITWLAILDASSEIPPQLIAQFIEQKPHWPYAARLRRRFEQSYASSQAAADETTLTWFQKYPPVSGAGKWMKAKALLTLKRNNEEAASLIRDAWVNGDFTSNVEEEILKKASHILTPELHQKRAERLVWDGQYSAVKRMKHLLPPAFMEMLAVRMALESLDKKAPGMLARLPKHLQSNPGIIYSRLVWRVSKNDNKGAMDLLLAAPKNPPFPEKWWKYRERKIRDAIDESNITLAARLLSNHGLEKGVEFAEAVWLKGWIKLEFQNRPKEAYAAFDQLYRGVTFAISKARAAYWAGRAAEALGDSATAATWYKNAAFFPTTFYGQLSYAKAFPNKPLVLPQAPTTDKQGYTKFQNSDLAQVLALCMKYNRMDIANRFMKDVIDNANSQQKMLHIALLARDFKGKSLGVKAAKRALQYNVLLGDIAYPTLAKTYSVLEAALTHAITRQESEFDPRALSPSGAMGLMQLMPATAREVAKKNGFPFGEAELYGEEYNTMLGSTFLASLIHRFEGSYVLAIASYNAGPGRVRQWISQFGRPTGSTEDIVNWIEKIPYEETRNYVQRVLENLQVYRAILGGDKGAALKIEQDLKR